MCQQKMREAAGCGYPMPLLDHIRAELWAHDGQYLSNRQTRHCLLCCAISYDISRCLAPQKLCDVEIRDGVVFNSKPVKTKIGRYKFVFWVGLLFKTLFLMHSD